MKVCTSGLVLRLRIRPPYNRGPSLQGWGWVPCCGCAGARSGHPNGVESAALGCRRCQHWQPGLVHWSLPWLLLLLALLLCPLRGLLVHSRPVNAREEVRVTWVTCLHDHAPL